MQSIFWWETPEDFYYYRSKSLTYQRYLCEKCWLKTVPHGAQFGWLKSVLGLFQVAKYERTELPPNIPELRKNGFKRWIIIWIPWHSKAVGTPWRRLMMPGAHFMTTWFSELAPDYQKKWNERAKRARKKFLANSELRVESVEHEIFANAFLQTKVTHMFRSDYVRYFRSLVSVDPKSVRSYLVYKGSKAIAWLAVHDFDHMSVHLVAFTSKEAKPLQAGTGLIDKWYSDSLEKWLKYIHFDHLRDPHMTKDQQGYTDFKKNFLDYLVKFPNAYFRFVWADTKE